MFFGCKKYCPGFPDNLLNYFPYQIGDTLWFLNQHHDTVSYRIDKYWASEQHYERKCGKCDCSPALHFDTDRRHGTMIGDLTSRKLYLQISCNFSYVPGEFTSGEYEIIADNNIPDLSAIFGDTVKFENNNQQISKLVIIKGKGITEFYDQKNNFQWKSINKTK